jgi:thiol-disulfide isomerase/thioredoxin
MRRKAVPIRPLLALAAALVCAPPFAARAADTPAGAVRITRAGADEILRAVRGSGAAATVVNMWATWCIPCREEFPELLRLRDEYARRGVALVLVSGDFDATLPEVEKFLAERGVRETYLKQGNDTDFINAFDREWSGALPATFVYDRAGTRRHSILGKTTYEALGEKVSAVLASQPGR